MKDLGFINLDTIGYNAVNLLKPINFLFDQNNKEHQANFV